MEENNNTTIPYLVYESTMARMDRNIKRLIIALIICIIVIFACNAYWLYAWMQYDYSGEEITVDSSDGIANYIGGSHDEHSCIRDRTSDDPTHHEPDVTQI